MSKRYTHREELVLAMLFSRRKERVMMAEMAFSRKRESSALARHWYRLSAEERGRRQLEAAIMLESFMSHDE